MGLYKRGKVWHMSFIYKGKRHRKSTETEDRRLAQRIYDKVKGEIAEGKWFERLPGEDKTFHEMMNKFTVEAIPEKSKVIYQSYLKAISNFLGEDSPLSSITPNRINEMKNHFKAKGEQVASINMKLRILKRMFNVAWKQWEWFNSNPISSISLLAGANQRDVWLSFEDERRIISHSPDWLKSVITFAINTGCRLTEIISLTWSEVNLPNQIILIPHSKNNEKRTIPLNQTVYEVLKEKSKIRSIHSDRVFLRDNKPLTKHIVQYHFKIACQKAEVRGFHFHDLRHTTGSRLVQAGVDLYRVQRLLGHKSPLMTQRYAHLSPSSLRKSVEVLSQNWHSNEISA
jgi:integrase